MLGNKIEKKKGFSRNRQEPSASGNLIGNANKNVENLRFLMLLFRSRKQNIIKNQPVAS
jgi:hypothetical protein